MRQFLIKLVIFCAPLVGAWLFVEWELHHIATSLLAKRQLIERHAPTARVLVLGTSIEYGGISPSLFDCDSVNLANPLQSLFLSAGMVRRFAPAMPQLRLVIFGISYGSFEAQLGDSPFSQFVYVYRHYLDTPLDSGVNFWDARSFSLIAAFGQDLVLSQILSGFSSGWVDPFDDYGWLGTNGTLDPAREADIVPPLDRLQSYMKLEHIPENLHAVEDMLTTLKDRNIQTVLITSPSAPQLIQHLDAARLERTRSLSKDLQSRFGVPYIDYLSDPRFITQDFNDPLHLNTTGAIKFSKILNDEVIRPRGLCQTGGASPQAPVTGSRPGSPGASQPP